MTPTIIRLALVAALLAPSYVVAQPANLDWQRYNNPAYGFSVELPMGRFSSLGATDAPGLALAEIGGEGQISLYGGPADGLTLEDFATSLSAGDQVRTITYQAEGNSWFVLSGFYDGGRSDDPLIFYAKVLMSSDHSRFSAFEISYPQSQKARYDSIVDRIEGSLTRPR